MQAGGTKAGNEVRLTDRRLEHIRPKSRCSSASLPKSSSSAPSPTARARRTTASAASIPTIRACAACSFADGSSFSEADDFTHNRVAFIGADVKKKLFSGQEAIGQSIRIDGISFQVVGVLKHVINNSDDNLNEHVYIPYSAVSDLKDPRYLDSIVMEYEGDHDKVVDALRRCLAYHHDFDPKDKRAVFVFDVFADLLDLNIITTGIKILLGFIGLLTLGIGGIGLMNIMLVSVTQRTREIGVEKALGARKWHILFQFLAEALVITFLVASPASPSPTSSPGRSVRSPSGAPSRKTPAKVISTSPSSPAPSSPPP